MIKIITPRGELGTRRVQLQLAGGSRVEQNHKAECNINSIIARYHRTGMAPQRSDSALYGDFSSAADFHQAKNSVIQAEADFMALPSELRSMFDNDPAKLLDFIDNPENAEEATKLGLLPQVTPDDWESAAPPVEPLVEPEGEPSE